ncbi:ribonuclease P protein component [Maribellus comscasis]|uniref:Ribonuclease P protein component n=2 Tax=Maribellus comscasis TaxID=2681766 RepID=A0A6I6K3Z7_9BACT|nr:ribonuclease P protein component [Maribellus comscasis]
MHNRSYTFKKKEKLCSKKVIDQLFSEGTSFISFPLKVIYLHCELPVKSKVQIGFSVSKKSFKKAVQRNLLKRRMREAYRLNKHLLTEKEAEKQLAIFVIFIGKKILDYNTIEQSMIKAMTKCSKINLPEK